MNDIYNMGAIKNEKLYLEVFTISKFNSLKAVLHVKYKKPQALNNIIILEPACIIDSYDVDADNNLNFNSSYIGMDFYEAISGITIDGWSLYPPNHADERTQKLAKKMSAICVGHPQVEVLRKQAKKIGAKFIDYNVKTHTFDNCVYEPGLDKLVALGYNIVKVF